MRRPSEALQAVMERIARLNPAYNAFAVLDPRAPAAAAASTQRWRAGRPLGPLDGVPCTVKDLIDVVGHPDAAGEPDDATAEPAVHDAPLVTGLRAAGCVIVGKDDDDGVRVEVAGGLPAARDHAEPAGTRPIRRAGLLRVRGRRGRRGSGRCMWGRMRGGACGSRRRGAGWWG